MTGSDKDLDRVVRAASRRMRLNRWLHLLPRTLVVAGAVGSAWFVAGRFRPLGGNDALVLAGLVVLALAASLTLTWTVRIRPVWAAWAADRWLSTKDALATAVEGRATGQLADEQRTQAQRIAGSFTGFPQRPRADRRMFAIGGLAVLVAAGLAWAPNPQDDVRERLRIERELVDSEAERLQELAEQLRETKDPAGERQAERLDELAAELDDASLQEALDAIADVRKELAAELDEDLAGLRTALNGLARELGQDPLAAGNGVREQLENLAQQAAEGSLSPEEQAELAERLRELAEALEAGAPEVANALSEAADALAQGDSSSAADALNAASQAVGEGLRQLTDQAAAGTADGAAAAAQQALRDALDALANGQDPLAQGQGQGQGEGQGEGQGQGQGQGQGEGQGEGQGQGQGEGQGQAQGGGGGGNPQGQQGTGSGSGGTPNAGAPGSLDLNTVFAPPRISGDGEDINLGGSDSGQGPDQTVGQQEGSGQRNQALVPYTQVLAEYRRLATEAINRPGFPADLRALVQSYFDALG